MVSTFTLCTIPGIAQAIQGLKRVLRPDGKFIIYSARVSGNQKLGLISRE